jgi:transcriptional regulator with XRE-family HTH domain
LSESVQPPSLGEKLNQVFDTLHPADRRPYSNREVAAWLGEHAEPGEPSISANYLAMLRSGERDNPTVNHLKAIARFFEIPTAYFLQDDETAAAVHEDLKMVAAMKDAQVRAIAARAMELDPSMRNWLHDTVTGLPTRQSSSRRSGRPRRVEIRDESTPGATDQSLDHGEPGGPQEEH